MEEASHVLSKARPGDSTFRPVRQWPRNATGCQGRSGLARPPPSSSIAKSGPVGAAPGTCPEDSLGEGAPGDGAASFPGASSGDKVKGVAQQPLRPRHPASSSVCSGGNQHPFLSPLQLFTEPSVPVVILKHKDSGCHSDERERSRSIPFPWKLGWTRSVRFFALSGSITDAFPECARGLSWLASTGDPTTCLYPEWRTVPSGTH